MRKTVIALMVSLLATSAARADNNLGLFVAGFVGAMLVTSYVQDEARKDVEMAQRINPPPAPPPPPTPRAKYIVTCQAYGFSEGYCIGIWDGKKPQGQ
jgi:hypothetical protein